MLMPKRVKRRRVHRGRMTGKCTKGNKIAYGEYGLVTFPCLCRYTLCIFLFAYHQQVPKAECNIGDLKMH